MSTQASPKKIVPKKQLGEQIAEHMYVPIPKQRASAPKPQQAPPSASMHGAGHYSGIHPDDMPYTTTRQDDEEIEIGPKRPPSSARRYRTTTPQEDTFKQGTRLVAKRKSKRSFVFGFTLLIVGCISIGVILAIAVPYFWRLSSDQLHYGYPRTYQTDVNVGHYPTHKDKRSHFIALNNQGYIEVIEIPEGVPTKPEEIHLYFVSLPANDAADQAPVTLDFEDINGDGKLDMEVSCNNNTTIFYNNGQGFQGRPGGSNQ